MKRWLNLATLWSRPRPPVGATPHDVVHRENKWQLLRYRPRPQGLAFATPVLLVPSLINRHYVLDLMPSKSFAEFMVAQGHEVYVIDWGTPGPEDRYVTFEDIADRTLGRAARVVARRAEGRAPHALGYCMGGTLVAIHAALHPDAFSSILALAAPISFVDDGLLSGWTRTRTLDLDALVTATGLVPWQLMQGAFQLLRPTLGLAKAVNLVDRAWNDRFLDGFVAMETWANDNVSLPGEFYRTYIQELYRDDRLAAGTFRLGGRSVDLGRITCPVLVASFAQDAIAPAASCDVLVDLVGSTDKQVLPCAGSHIGGVTSRPAAKHLWPLLSQWWAARDGAAAAAS